MYNFHHLAITAQLTQVIRQRSASSSPSTVRPRIPTRILAKSEKLSHSQLLSQTLPSVMLQFYPRILDSKKRLHLYNRHEGFLLSLAPPNPVLFSPSLFYFPPPRNSGFSITKKKREKEKKIKKHTQHIRVLQDDLTHFLRFEETVSALITLRP